jgi:hypothetical protein
VYESLINLGGERDCGGAKACPHRTPPTSIYLEAHSKCLGFSTRPRRTGRRWRQTDGKRDRACRCQSPQCIWVLRPRVRAANNTERAWKGEGLNGEMVVISARKKCHQTTPLRLSCKALWERSQLSPVWQSALSGTIAFADARRKQPRRAIGSGVRWVEHPPRLGEYGWMICRGSVWLCLDCPGEKCKRMAVCPRNYPQMKC